MILSDHFGPTLEAVRVPYSDQRVVLESFCAVGRPSFQEIVESLLDKPLGWRVHRREVYKLLREREDLCRPLKRR